MVFCQVKMSCRSALLPTRQHFWTQLSQILCTPYMQLSPLYYQSSIMVQRMHLLWEIELTLKSKIICFWLTAQHDFRPTPDAFQKRLVLFTGNLQVSRERIDHLKRLELKNLLASKGFPRVRMLVRVLFLFTMCLDQEIMAGGLVVRTSALFAEGAALVSRDA